MVKSRAMLNVVERQNSRRMLLFWATSTLQQSQYLTVQQFRDLSIQPSCRKVHRISSLKKFQFSQLNDKNSSPYLYKQGDFFYLFSKYCSIIYYNNCLHPYFSIINKFSIAQLLQICQYLIA